MPCSWVHFCLSISIYESCLCLSILILVFFCFLSICLFLSHPSLFFSISPRPCLSLLRDGSMYPTRHVSILLSPSGWLCSSTKLLPVSKWLVLSPLQSEGTGTGCDEWEEVFIMNRILCCLHKHFWRHREGKQTILQLNVIKHGGVSRKRSGR